VKVVNWMRPALVEVQRGLDSFLNTIKIGLRPP
jgi:hypothetical protein